MEEGVGKERLTPLVKGNVSLDTRLIFRTCPRLLAHIFHLLDLRVRFSRMHCLSSWGSVGAFSGHRYCLSSDISYRQSAGNPQVP